MLWLAPKPSPLPIYTPCKFIYSEISSHVEGSFCGGASRVLVPVAVLASLGLRWPVVGSNDFLNLWDHVLVQVCAGIGGLGPLLFLIIAGLVALARSSFSS